MWIALSIILGLAWILYSRYKPIPEEIQPPPRKFLVEDEDIQFIADVQWGKEDERKVERNIFDAQRRLIADAQQYVIIDVFLFNQHHIDVEDYVPTTRIIADTVKEKNIPVLFLTDPINIHYGTAVCLPLEWMRDAGATVCITDIDRLPENNIILGPLYRPFAFLGTGRGYIESPLKKGEKITIRAALKAMCAKGNHRKVVIADDTVNVSSSNMEDSSSYYGNVGVEIRHAGIAAYYARASASLAHYSGCEWGARLIDGDGVNAEIEVTPLFGKHILKALLDDIRNTGPGDRIYCFMLFLSHRRIINDLIRAQRRGVQISVVLDSNTNSFGKEKMGVPNQPVAQELVRRSDIEVRWVEGRLLEFHTKFLAIVKDGSLIAHLGSANFTRRSLLGTNLEANCRICAPEGTQIHADVNKYCERIMKKPYSLPHERHRFSIWKYIFYRIQEHTGFASF